MSVQKINFKPIDPLDEEAREFLRAQLGFATIRYMTREQLVKEFPPPTE